MITVSTPIECR